MSETDDLIMGGGGRKLPSIELKEVGDKVKGVITRISKPIQAKEHSGPRKGQPKVWPSSDPVMQVAIELKTAQRNPLDSEDDGSRTWWVRQSSDAQRALRDGIAAAGKSAAEVGAVVEIELIGKDETFSIPKHLHSVVYTPAGQNAANDVVMASAGPAPSAPAGVDVSQLTPEMLELIKQAQGNSQPPF